MSLPTTLNPPALEQRHIERQQPQDNDNDPANDFSDQRRSPRPSFNLYDRDNRTILPLSESPDRVGEWRTLSRSSMQGDESHRPIPVWDWPRSARQSNRRRRSTSLSSRPPSERPFLSSPSYFPPPSPDPVPQPSNTGFPGPPSHHPPSGSFPQNSGYYGQYTAPTQALLTVAHSPPYTYPHTFHSPGPENILGQTNYPSIGQPRQPPYHFQQHPQDDGNAAASTSRFSSHTTPRTTVQPPAGTRSPSYMGQPGYFPSMAYTPPLTNPQYSYPHQFLPSHPGYNRYGAVLYPPSPQESPQGAWYYVSHVAAPPPQYHYDGGQYQNPYMTQQYPSHAQHQDPSSFSSGSRNLLPPASSRNTAQSLTPTSPSVVPAGTSIGSQPPGGSVSVAGKSVSRREWHPRPPPHRSPWVMWVGNVPSDATQEELWNFFTSSLKGALSVKNPVDSGLVSVFLIARSNCAFVNYSSESSLESAIQTFNGLRLRPNDPQCPMLVCKIRRSSDDLKSGVGGQRGIGLHKQWVKEQRYLQQNQAPASGQAPAGLPAMSPPSSVTSSKNAKTQSSSDSFASTTSSLLGDNFPNRYFILKSLSEHDLELSVEGGLWATQKHNEAVLDRAFRNSRNVFLIFSVNKSGEFYGYARMTGPIRHGEGNVSWTSRQRSSSSSDPSLSIYSQPKATSSDPRLLSTGSIYDSPQSLLVGGPQPQQDQQGPPVQRKQSSTASSHRHHQSAPAQLGDSKSPPVHSPPHKFSLDHHQRRLQNRKAKLDFQLDPDAPFRAMKGPPSVEVDQIAVSVVRNPVDEGHEDGEDDGLVKPPTWGDCFRVEWLERRKVPFHRTRHLRNPWNKGREIKVSRDGTELESMVGRRLLEEWGDLAVPVSVT